MDVVTGAFSYTGSYIARRLLALGREVRTLSRRPDPGHPLAAEVSFAPLDFGSPTALTESLRGAETLYNTYWVRFPHGEVTYERAIENTRTLVRAAEEAGVRRIVHISVANPAEDSPLPYFRGKAVVERELCASPLSAAIVRPTLIFGVEDVLVHNIAWGLRRFPVFVVPGAGDYRVQPVAAEDVAEIAVAAGERGDEVTIDAVGPEIYTFDELVRTIARAVGSRSWIAHAGPRLALALCAPVGWAHRDVLLTRDELECLIAGLLVCDGPATGKLRFSEWLAENADGLGRRYVSELARNYRAPL